MNSQLTEQQAELLGMHTGDGTLYETASSTVWELRGGLNEKEYYKQHVAPLLEKTFEKKFTPKFRSGGKNGCFGIQTTDKDVTHFFKEQGFKPGRKTHTVRIPKQIKDSLQRNKLAFVRGYFDTDGCLRFDKINKRKYHDYPKIEFCSVSIDMIDDLFTLMTELGFRAHRWGNNEFKMCIAGVKNLEKFVKDVKPKNTKHLNKYKTWRIEGKYTPRPHKKCSQG